MTRVCAAGGRQGYDVSWAVAGGLCASLRTVCETEGELSGTVWVLYGMSCTVPYVR